MQAMLLEKTGSPLIFRETPVPEPDLDEVRIKVSACGVCRTDLHIFEGELSPPKLPLILGHQIVGTIDKCGAKVSGYRVGDRVGVPWLGGSCGRCPFCVENRENLCDAPTFTGFHRNGGFAEYSCAHQDFIFPLPKAYDDLHAAPLLCAGMIGYRALHLLGEARALGLYGFGSAAHLLIQLALKLGRQLYIFTRPGDAATQAFARKLGATWAGGSDERPPVPLDGAILFAPIGGLFVEALQSIKKGGKVISAGIHMSDIPSFPYRLLWEERTLSSVANLTRKDGKNYLALIEKHPVKPEIHSFPLSKANEALLAIKNGSLRGSVVLFINK